MSLAGGSHSVAGGAVQSFYSMSGLQVSALGPSSCLFSELDHIFALDDLKWAK
jgi:hypothetical protein